MIIVVAVLTDSGYESKASIKYDEASVSYENNTRRGIKELLVTGRLVNTK